jgi:hypothetical protein
MLTPTAEAHNNAPWSMFGPPTLLGLAHDYPNMSKWIDDNLIPETASTFRIPEQSCFVNYYSFDGKDTGIYFKRGFKSIFDPVPMSVIDAAGRPLCFPKSPGSIIDNEQVPLEN